MEYICKPENSPAPAAISSSKIKEYSNCTYLCFRFDKNINKNNFKLSNNYLSLKIEPINNLFVFCIFSEGLFNNAAIKWFKNNFNIYYESKNMKTSDYTFEKGKIKFIFDTGNNGSNQSYLFRNPSCLEQYKAFCSVSKEHEKIFVEAKNYLSSSLDIELMLYLLEEKKEKKSELMNIFKKFPNFKIKYDRNKTLIPIDFSKISDNENYKILVLVYSIIQDSKDLLVDFTENDIKNFLLYNEKQKDSPLIIEKNIFRFLIYKFNDESFIKQICKNVQSIPTLFDYINSLEQEQIKKIKNLNINDLPDKYPANDDLINLIEKYEKIKDVFEFNEIEEILRRYLILSYGKKSILELELIVEKLSSINENGYAKLIKEIKKEIINKGKHLIRINELKSLAMYKFINKYKDIGNFYSDEYLSEHIGENIDLEELSNNSNTLEEFTKCNFMNMINFLLISKYINGILSKIQNLTNFYLFFKYIYVLKEKEIENEEKNNTYIILILSHFKNLLYRISKIIINEEFKSIVQKILLLSIKYVPYNNGKNDDFEDIIKSLGNYGSYSGDNLFNMFIDIIINPNLDNYIANKQKEKVCEFIIKKYFFSLNIEKKIDMLLKIKSVEIREKLIFNNKEHFPIIEFSDLLNKEENVCFKNMKYFIEKGLIKNDEFLKEDYFKNLILNCEKIKEKLDKKEIYFFETIKIQELIKKNKFSERIYFICLGDSKKSEELITKINIYAEKYIYYCEKLDKLITYYDKYYPNSKKEEINIYSLQQSNFKAKVYICNIEIKEQIYEEIKIFQKYEKSKFFSYIYNDIKDIKDEINKFKRAIEIFNELEKLFNGKDFNIQFLENPLDKFEEDNINGNLLNEIKHLKENFNYKNSDEKIIIHNLLFFKNRKKISYALKSFFILCEKFSVQNMKNFKLNINKLSDDIENIKNYLIIPEHTATLKKFDENFLDKNFLEVLNMIYRKEKNEQNEQLIIFLNNQKESETRDLIDGLFDDDNEDIVTIELKDIEILINVVCFFQELKTKIQNINVFLNNFHSVLNEKKILFKDIVSNIAHVKEKFKILQDFVKIQLGKKYKYSTNIQNFIESGIIIIDKFQRKKSMNSLLKDLFLGKNFDDFESYFNAIIKIEDKEENFELFLATIKKIKAKNAYKYGKNKEYLLRCQKIASIFESILKELNYNPEQNFKKEYKVSELKFEYKGILTLPDLEDMLENLRMKNNQIRIKKLRDIDNKNIFSLFQKQYLEEEMLYAFIDSIDIESYQKKEKIESYFPDIQKLENINIHKHYEVCDECSMFPIIGIRYKCKVCNRLNYCQNCFNKNKDKHCHEFEKIEIPRGKEVNLDKISNILISTQIKSQYNKLKGIFFYESKNKMYEIDILKLYNELIGIIPYYFNMLLCYDKLEQEDIYSFCVRAINCKTNNLFIVVRPEELKINQEKVLLNSFKKLLEKNGNKIETCIIILFIEQKSHIIKQLKNLAKKCKFQSESELFNKIENLSLDSLKALEALPVEIVTSDLPRVGKTSYIQSQIKNTKYFIFTLGDIDELYLGLNTLILNKFREQNISLIFELYENPNENAENLIKKFLFKFIILKHYELFNYIDKKNIKIYIEVSSDYTNYEKDYKFLRLFKKHFIKFKNCPDFYTRNKIYLPKEDKIYIVLNALKIVKPEINSYEELIKELFIKKYPSESKSKNLPNFGQIKIFFDLFGDLINELNKFSQLSPESVKLNKKKFPFLTTFKKKIIESYIEFVIKFSTLSYESILENQIEAAKYQKELSYKLSDKKKNELIEKMNKKRIVTFNDINHGIVLYNDRPISNQYNMISICSILKTHKKNKEDDEYKLLNKFYHEYLKYPTLQNLLDVGASEYRTELKNICLTSDDLSEYVNIKLALNGYVLTIDNFIKMVLIYLRIRAKVPLILLGETGCGKTSLIESLIFFIQDRYNLIKFSIYSGINYVDIDNYFKSLKLYEDDENSSQFNIILFLDEINTTNSLNLLCDLFVKHSFLGKKLKSNVIIMAACNPYRLMLSNNEEIGYINKKIDRVRNLVYTVNPLPLCLINYIFDFGSIKEEDENEYIEKFVDTFLGDNFSKKNRENYSKILKIIIKAVHESQKYIRKNSEISSVSLREIKRFKIFFEFFFQKIKDREEFKNPDYSCIKDNSIFSEITDPEEKKEDLIVLKAANLGIFMCYYLRIMEPEKRAELVKIVEDIFKFDFLEFPKKLQNELADSLKLDGGIAKNRALLDNIFTLFVCLNNNVPIFICGKAGCSKSLSFSLLFQAMKGEYSTSELFKKYPSLYVTSYQGSLTSNSEEIKKIFIRAKKVLSKQKKTERKNLSVILFDELGLAEISPNNPLKVIHSELDDKNEIGFVGISNWTLDASKMNRGIHLSILEPTEKDLTSTALTIAKNIFEDIEKIDNYKKLIENLTKSYFEYKKFIQNYCGSNYNFHGLRDFYNLIKITAKSLKNKESNKSIEKIAMVSIERNFGGFESNFGGNNLCSSIQKFKEIFRSIQNSYVEDVDKYDIFSCIKNNLEYDYNRYLLLITNKTKNETLIEFILKKLKKQYGFIQGSKLKEDQNEDYVLEKTWSIISLMENGEIIILKDLEIIYPKFYDLFNQNFQKFGESNYARIVLDSTTNERRVVNKNFRCIVLLEQKDVKEQDPPFLNRFEKHLMSFRYLLTEQQNILSKNIFNEIINLTSIPEDKDLIPLLVNINIEEIRCLLLDIITKYDDNIDNHFDEIFKLLIPTFTEENILQALFAPQKKYTKKENLIKYYEENTHTNIYKFLKEIKFNKLIIYTFSPYYKDIFTDDNMNEFTNEKYGIISKKNTVEILFNEKLSEKMLNYFLQLYYEKENYNLFIMHFSLNDSKFIKYIKYQIDEFHKINFEKDKKIYLFIIHINKNYGYKIKPDNENLNNLTVENLERYHSYFLSFLSEYRQITIDNLLEQWDISVIELFNKTNEELIVFDKLFDINLILKNEFSNLMIKEGFSFNDQIDNLLENGVINCFIKKIQSIVKNSNNILRDILVAYSSIKEKDDDFISFFLVEIKKKIVDYFGKLIKELIEHNYFVSYLFEKEIPPTFKKIIFSFIENINITNSTISINSDKFISNLKIPGSLMLFKNIAELVNICKIDYLNSENEYRKPQKKKRGKDEKNENKRNLEDIHYEKKQFIKNRLWNEELLTEDILSNYFNEILKDYFIFFSYEQNGNCSLSTKQEDFLFFIFSKKNENCENMDRFLYFCLWVGAYHETIYKILEIFNKLDKYFKPKKNMSDSQNLSHDNQTLLDSLKENYNLFDKSDIEYKSVNNIFYSISESFCHAITNINNIDIESIDLKSFCADINDSAQILIQLNSTFNLGLKGQYTFLSISKFIEFSQKNNNYNQKEFREILSTFIKNIYFEKCFIFEKNDIEQAKKALIEQIKILNSLSSELSSKILVNKLLQYTKHEQYKLEIVRTLFEFKHLVKFSSLFFNYIFITQPITPKRQNKRRVANDDKEEYFKSFGEIKNLDKNLILKEINTYTENNEILKEILLYIFELSMFSYFENCKKSKVMEGEENQILILTGLNFDYFKKACDEINNNNFGALKNLGLVFYFSYIRCYLYYFVKLQLENHNFGDLSMIHHHLFDISKSSFGRLIILYIAKIFILNNKTEYFLNSYLSKEKANNWKISFLSDNPEDEFFPIEKIENSKHLLFNIWANINNDNFKNYAKNLEIYDIYDIIDFSYNEMSIKIKNKISEKSIILEKLNEEKEELKFNKNIKSKIFELFKKISDFNFFSNEIIKKNLKLIFLMIKFYILGFVGSKNNLLFSFIFADGINYLIKIFYNNNIQNEINLIQSYYEMKNYLEEEYLVKKNYNPIYLCSCARWYANKDSSLTKIINCKCGLKLGKANETTDEKENHYAIFYDEYQKKFIEDRKLKTINGIFKLKGIEELKDEFIIKKIIDNSQSLDQLILVDNNEINDEIFPQIFLKFMFLSQIYIEYKIGIISKNDIMELNPDNLLNYLIDLNKKIEEFIKEKNIKYDDFINYLCEKLFNLVKNTDCIRNKEKIFNNISILLKQLEEKYKNSIDEQEFNNLEINILTLLTFDKEFKNENYKYLLTPAQYPHIELLKASISSYIKRPLPILNSFMSLNIKKYNIEHLSYIESINDFINSFAEKTRNLITRKSANNEKIGDYLSEIRKSSELDEMKNYLIDKQFKEFSYAYENIFSESITEDSLVIKILNDDKIKGKETAINKLYSHLIEIQNYYLNSIINEYNNRKIADNEDIIVKNAIEQIKKKKCIQHCTKADIFSFKVSNKTILSFEELYSFYSLKNIFNEKDNKIDYSKYSEVKFKLKEIEKELANIILTGKKLFSEKQIKYKFYLDPYEVEEKTTKFEIFTEIYKKENLTSEEKSDLFNLSFLELKEKRIIMPNLETLIFYLIQENKYQGTNKIEQIKSHSNLNIDKRFFELFNNFTINKLISIYEYLEEVLFGFIKDQYIIQEFQKEIPYEYEQKLEKYYMDESKRELKNDLLTSLLIKFCCRYLPHLSKESEIRGLFQMIREKNINLSEQIQLDLENLVNNDSDNSLDAKLSYAIGITKFFIRKKRLNPNDIPQNQDNNNNKGQKPNVEEQEEIFEEEEKEDREA